MEEIKETIRRIEIQTKQLALELLAGMYHSAFKGQGVEFDEVRPYQEGDDVRSIDWNVTARMGDLYIKRFIEERELTVILMIDISASSLFGTNGLSKKEIIAQIAATLAFSAIKNHDKVGLILFSSEVEKYLPPKKGTQHVLRVIRELLTHEPKRKKTSLSNALAYLAKVEKKRGVVFILSDFFGTKYSHPLSILSKKHDLISIRVVDPIEKKLPNVGILTLEDLETGKVLSLNTNDPEITQEYEKGMEEKRKQLEKTCKKYDVGLIEIQTDKHFIEPIRTFFRNRKERR